MAKSWSNGIMILDGAAQGFGVDTASGPTSSSSTGLVSSYIRVKSITVDASADAWVCVLSNQDGSVAWTAKGSATGDRGGTFDVGQLDFRGIVLTTATNLTRVILSTESIRS